MGADSGYHHCTRASQGEGGPPDEAAGKISNPAAAGRARMWPAKAAAAAI